MIRSVLTLHPSVEDLPQVEELFAESDVLGYSMEETRGRCVELATSVDGGVAEVMVTAVWPDRAAYQEWVEHPHRGDRTPGLAELVGEVGVARLYETRMGAYKKGNGAVERT